MIAVDTSALMAIIGDEPMAGPCKDVLQGEGRILVSAVTLAEALIVAAGRGVAAEMALLIDILDPEIEPVSAIVARRVATLYERFGKGFHPASLNYCDCFAYDTAAHHGVPLLYIGNDFVRTDIESVL